MVVADLRGRAVKSEPVRSLDCPASGREGVWTQAAAAYEQDLEQAQLTIPTALRAADLVNMIVGMLSAPVPLGARRQRRCRQKGKNDTSPTTR